MRSSCMGVLPLRHRRMLSDLPDLALRHAQDHEESSNVTLDAAMGLYKLHSFELLWEKALDTKVWQEVRVHTEG